MHKRAFTCSRARKTAKTYETMTNLGVLGGRAEDKEREAERREMLEQANIMVGLASRSPEDFSGQRVGSASRSPEDP
eukprot:364824-Chlamydomonas_euryale.AAC.10